jgi:Mn-containing catalase
MGVGGEKRETWLLDYITVLAMLLDNVRNIHIELVCGRTQSVFTILLFTHSVVRDTMKWLVACSELHQ